MTDMDDILNRAFERAGVSFSDDFAPQRRKGALKSIASVTRCIGEGLTRQQTAERTGLSYKTVSRIIRDNGLSAPRQIRSDARRVKCAVPGCGSNISGQARSGVCRKHNHTKPYCRCIQCALVSLRQTKEIRNSLDDWRSEELSKRIASGYLLSVAAASIGISLGTAKRLRGIS